jgi:hypothetical protein
MKKSNRERLTEQSSQIQNCFHGVWQSKNKWMKDRDEIRMYDEST